MTEKKSKSTLWKKLLDEEKSKIKRIKVESQHELAEERWLNIKGILDAIYVLISPIERKKKIGKITGLSEESKTLFNFNLGQKIFLNPDGLLPEQKKYFESTLKHLLDIQVVSYENYESIVHTSKPVRKYFNGNILIKNRQKFEEYHNAVSEFCDFIKKDGERKFSSSDSPAPKRLGGQKIVFDDEKALLSIGGKPCQLPPFKNEHYFCRAVFEHGVNEPIDWSIIYEKISGYYEAYFGKPPVKRKGLRAVYDTMEALNKRVKHSLGIKENLFSWTEKTVKRNY